MRVLFEFTLKLRIGDNRGREPSGNWPTGRMRAIFSLPQLAFAITAAAPMLSRKLLSSAGFVLLLRHVSGF